MNSELFSLLIHHSSFIIPHLLRGFGYAGGHGRGWKSDRRRRRSPWRGHLEVPFIVPAARPGRTVAVKGKSLTVIRPIQVPRTRDFGIAPHEAAQAARQAAAAAMSPGAVATATIPCAVAARATASRATTTDATCPMAACAMPAGTAQTRTKFVTQPLRQVRALGRRFLLRHSQERHRQESRHDKFLHGPNPFPN